MAAKAKTFLQLCQRLRQEAGLSGTGPSTTVGQVGDMKRVVDWIEDAYLDIQNDHTTWRFLRNTFSFSTTASDQDYTPTQAGIASPGLKNWVKEDIKIYLTSAGVSNETELEYVPWDFFKANYMFGSHRTQEGYPSIVTVDPSDTLFLWQLPNAIYTVSGEYYANADEFADEGAYPIFDEDFHMVIVWRALMYYGAWAAADEKYAHGNNEHRKLFRSLELKELEEPTFGEPLA